VFQIPSGRQLSVFASALVTGTPEFPLFEIPFQAIVERVAAGSYMAKPRRVFRFDEIREAERPSRSGRLRSRERDGETCCGAGTGRAGAAAPRLWAPARWIEVAAVL